MKRIRKQTCMASFDKGNLFSVICISGNYGKRRVRRALLADARRAGVTVTLRRVSPPSWKR